MSKATTTYNFSATDVSLSLEKKKRRLLFSSVCSVPDAAASLAPRLVKALTSGRGAIRVDVSSSLRPSGRKVLTDAVASHVKEFLLQRDCVCDESGGDGWDGDRLTVSEKLAPSLRIYGKSTEYGAFIGFWTDPRTMWLLCLNDYSSNVLSSVASVDVRHWHPGSLCSGSWSDSLTMTPFGFSVARSFKDEDGFYYKVSPESASSPRDFAERIEKEVSRWDLYGAERVLIEALFLGFNRGYVDVLNPYTDNPGYEIERCDLTGDRDVIELLKERNRVSPEEAKGWLEDLEESNIDRYYLDNSDLVATLRDLAQES